jgi:hypothetical protein
MLYQFRFQQAIVVSHNIKITMKMKIQVFWGVTP